MLFNHTHINITRANYEEAFLLYIDGELNAADTAAVEAFVLHNPDLQEELNLLLTTKLDGEVFILEDKENLLAQAMKADVTDESLLLYIDGELSEKEQLHIEKKLAADKDFCLQYKLLMSTKLPVDEAVIYTNKTELYRHTEKRSMPLWWMRIAAAIIILLGIGILWTNMRGKKEEGFPTIVQVQDKKVDLSIKKPKELLSKQPNQEIALQESLQLKEEKIIPQKTSAKKHSVLQPLLPAPDDRDRVTALHQPVREKISAHQNAILQEVRQQQTINNPTVTTPTTPAYTMVDGTAKPETMVGNAVALSNDEKKGSVRGFLRKASRFIERRTGINPVNDDDELMIGVVALKLK